MTMVNTRAQSTVEFTFAMIVIMFLIYGMVRVFRWVGMDLANRRVAQDSSMTAGNYNALAQLNPDFYRVQSMDSLYTVSITTSGTTQ